MIQGHGRDNDCDSRCFRCRRKCCSRHSLCSAFHISKSIVFHMTAETRAETGLCLPCVQSGGKLTSAKRSAVGISLDSAPLSGVVGLPPADTVWTDVLDLGIHGRGWNASDLVSPFNRCEISFLLDSFSPMHCGQRSQHGTNTTE